MGDPVVQLGPFYKITDELNQLLTKHAAGHMVPALGEAVARRSYAIATRGKRQYVESVFARKMPRVFGSVDVANRTLFPGDLRSQTEQCVQQLEFIIQAGGGTLDNIVKTTVYLMQGMDRNVSNARGPS